jgi:hypothetical protein
LNLQESGSSKDALLRVRNNQPQQLDETNFRDDTRFPSFGTYCAIFGIAIRRVARKGSALARGSGRRFKMCGFRARMIVPMQSMIFPA